MKIAVLLLSGCAIITPKPSPDDVCRVPCINAIGNVDVYVLDGKTCTCYREPDLPFDPGAFVQVPL